MWGQARAPTFWQVMCSQFCKLVVTRGHHVNHCDSESVAALYLAKVLTPPHPHPPCCSGTYRPGGHNCRPRSSTSASCAACALGSAHDLCSHAHRGKVVAAGAEAHSTLHDLFNCMRRCVRDWSGCWHVSIPSAGCAATCATEPWPFLASRRPTQSEVTHRLAGWVAGRQAPQCALPCYLQVCRELCGCQGPAASSGSAPTGRASWQSTRRGAHEEGA